MTDVPVSYRNADVRGRAAFEALDRHTDQQLLSPGSKPLPETTRILLGSSLTLAVFTVVGLDANNKLVKATYDADPDVAIKPIGVLAHAATSGASNTTIHGEVFLEGSFNADTDSPLVWDSSFTTLARKTASVVASPYLAFTPRRATGSPGA